MSQGSRSDYFSKHAPLVAFYPHPAIYGRKSRTERLAHRDLIDFPDSSHILILIRSCLFPFPQAIPYNPPMRLLALILLAFPALCFPADIPFHFLNYETYTLTKELVRSRDGEQIFHQLCFEAPPGCQSTSNACTNHPEYTEIDWGYRFVWNSPSQKTELKKVVLKSDPRLANGLRPMQTGEIIVWAESDENQKAALAKYLTQISGGAEARRRFFYFEKMAQEILWHERQHVKHGIGFNESLQRIFNSPLFPDAVRIAALTGNASDADPEPKLQTLVTQDREARVRKSLQMTETCSSRFHAFLALPKSYPALVEECACHGGSACYETLPPFPPADFICEF